MESALLLSLLTASFVRGDQIVEKNGTTVNGQITGVTADQVSYTTQTTNGGTASSVIYLSDVQSISMPTPDAVTQLKNAPPATVIATLEPLLKQYAGLPADWVVDAMARLADAYETQGQSEMASGMYAKINELYPDNTSYQNEASAGMAKALLKEGKIPDALALVKPIVDKANQNLAPSASEAHGYAAAFLVYGQALEAQKQYGQALEAYLTVKTMFYQNPALVDQAEQLTKNLRTEAPGVSVD